MSVRTGFASARQASLALSRRPRVATRYLLSPSSTARGINTSASTVRRSFAPYIAGLSAVAAGALYTATASPVQQDTDHFATVDPKFAPLFPEETWKPDASVNPFLRRVSSSGTEYWLLGLGMRMVSFLKMYVYAVGIYVAKEDLPAVMTAVSAASPEAALDTKSGTELFSALLDSHTRFALRIVPVRNTDFSHLRDGFVRSIIASMKSHAAIFDSHADTTLGISEFRNVFGRKLTVPKNGELLMVIRKDGTLECTYAPRGAYEKEVLGTVTDKDVIKALFLHYLAGPNAASEQARTSLVDSIAKLL
ncbi:chalcone-flavanone isomerase-domain-containing protein [Limtongia smithiae]|uniref:chalcone-flavanone isomerase-domain-containing protein n=1 Tax=Limtongia smithiae TaxID=1125753 RepID=UPI0034CE5274